MKTKVCTKCGIVKPISDFYKQKDGKFGVRPDCKECVKKRNKNNWNITSKLKNLKRREKNRKEPWILIYSNIKRRCLEETNLHYKRYGGRGIKVLITLDEIKFLWFRDKAWLLKKPSIDREDNDGNYELSNCRFIEHKENSAKDKRKPVLQFTLDGKFINEFSSLVEANKQTGISNVCISYACNKIYKTSGNYIWEWKYKNENLN